MPIQPYGASPNAIAVDAAGGVYLTGKALNPPADLDYITVKLNSEGVEQWRTLYDGPNSHVIKNGE